MHYFRILSWSLCLAGAFSAMAKKDYATPWIKCSDMENDKKATECANQLSETLLKDLQAYVSSANALVVKYCKSNSSARDRAVCRALQLRYMMERLTEEDLTVDTSRD